jgi:hypothetical protein
MPDTSIHKVILAALLLAAAGCTERGGANAQTTSACEAPRRVADLPAGIDEASGVVFSPADPDVLWVHNDSDDRLYALDRQGRLLASVELPGDRPRDWEDIATGPCAAGGTCLYLADIGDNEHVRAAVTVLRVPEPALTAASTSTPERFEFQYPGGPRDAEAIFLLGGRLHIVSKGRNGPIALYRAPARLTAGPTLLEHVRTFTDGLVQIPDQVTGAAAAGAWVALRTYRYLDVYRVHGDTLAAEASFRVSLAGLDEPQGEGVALNGAGEIFLVSENERSGAAPLSYLRCELR